MSSFAVLDVDPVGAVAVGAAVGGADVVGHALAAGVVVRRLHRARDTAALLGKAFGGTVGLGAARRSPASGRPGPRLPGPHSPFGRAVTWPATAKPAACVREVIPFLYSLLSFPAQAGLVSRSWAGARPISRWD